MCQPAFVAQPAPELRRLLLTQSRLTTEIVSMSHTDIAGGLGAQLEQIRWASARSTTVIHRVLTDYGWPGVRLVGRDGEQAAWELTMRADDVPHLLVTAQRLLHEAASRGDAPWWQWAYLSDRIAVTRRAPQSYGTQFELHRTQRRLYQCAAPEKLTQRRRSVGLPPLHGEPAALGRAGTPQAVRP